MMILPLRALWTVENGSHLALKTLTSCCQFHHPKIHFNQTVDLEVWLGTPVLEILVLGRTSHFLNFLRKVSCRRLRRPRPPSMSGGKSVGFKQSADLFKDDRWGLVGWARWALEVC